MRPMQAKALEKAQSSTFTPKLINTGIARRGSRSYFNVEAWMRLAFIAEGVVVGGRVAELLAS
jgi:hypothetical protein